MRLRKYISAAIAACLLLMILSNDADAGRRKIRKELTQHEKDSVKRDAATFIDRGAEALSRGDTAKALFCYESAYPMAVLVSDNEGILKAGTFLSSYYMQTGKRATALKMLERIYDIAVIKGDKELRFNTATTLATQYEVEGNPGAAYPYMKELTEQRDSVMAIQQAEVELALRSAADKQIKDANEAAEKKIRIMQDAMQITEYQLYIAAGAALLFLIAWIVTWARISGLKKKLQQSHMENQHIILREKQNAAVIEKLNQELRELKHAPKPDTAAREMTVQESKAVTREQVLLKEAADQHEKNEKQAAGNRILTPEEKYRTVFLKLVPQRLRQIEDSLKRSDWQQIQRLISQMEPQLLDSGMTSIKPLLEQIDRMDGKTSYLTWHTSVKEFCDRVHDKLNELQAV